MASLWNSSTCVNLEICKSLRTQTTSSSDWRDCGWGVSPQRAGSCSRSVGCYGRDHSLLTLRPPAPRSVPRKPSPHLQNEAGQCDVPAKAEQPPKLHWPSSLKWGRAMWLSRLQEHCQSRVKWRWASSKGFTAALGWDVNRNPWMCSVDVSIS